MIQYILLGLVAGSIYALAAIGVLSTYVSSGVLNFAYGAFAYFVARFYYFLHVQHAWSIGTAAVFSICVFSPLAGLALWAVLLRRLSQSSTVVQVAATVGVSIALPPLAELLFGSPVILIVPGLAPAPVALYHVFGIIITLDQVITLSCLVVVLAVGAIVMRKTSAGLLVRAVVDSHSMSELSGINAGRVGAAVWAFSFFLAGLVGVLVAPILGLGSVNFQFLLATAFAALIVARLRSPGRAVIAALAIGVLTALVQKYAPPSSSLAQEAIPAVPFAIVFVFIILQFRRAGEISGGDGGPGADHLSAADHLLRQPLALATTVTNAVGQEATRLIRALRSARRATPLSLLLLALALLPVLLSGYWAAVLADGFAFGIVFLSFTLLTGEGGFISLAQAAFAGIGSVALGQLASAAGLPAVPSLLLAGLAGLAVGLLLGLLTVRLGTLYVALITLTFGLLMDNVVFALPRFVNNGSGVVVARPEFFGGDRAFAYLALGVFVIAALFVFNIKRSTTGLAIVAARWSPTASSTLGLSTTMIRVLLVGVASAIAATGGAILTWFQQEALPSYFVTPSGLLWLAVAVAIGVRSIPAALFAGVSLTVFPALVANYLPTWWTPVPTLLFGLAAIGMVRQPDGLAGDIAALYRWITQRAGRIGVGPTSAPRVESEARDQTVSNDSRSVDASTVPQ